MNNWEIIETDNCTFYWILPEFETEGEIKLTEESAKADLINTLLDKINKLHEVSHLYWDEY